MTCQIIDRMDSINRTARWIIGRGITSILVCNYSFGKGPRIICSGEQHALLIQLFPEAESIVHALIDGRTEIEVWAATDPRTNVHVSWEREIKR